MVAQPARLTAEQFLFLEEAFAVSCALAAAGELGVLERLDAGPLSSQPWRSDNLRAEEPSWTDLMDESETYVTKET